MSAADPRHPATCKCSMCSYLEALGEMDIHPSRATIWPKLWCETCRDHQPVSDSATTDAPDADIAPRDLCCVHCGLVIATYLPDQRAARVAVGGDAPEPVPMKQIPVEVECCPDWKPGLERINGPIVLQQLRAGRSLPSGHFAPWRACPWCGAARVAPEADATPEPNSSKSSNSSTIPSDAEARPQGRSLPEEKNPHG